MDRTVQEYPAVSTGDREFRTAAPFPHAVLDGLWGSDELLSIRAEFPAYDAPGWIGYNDPEEAGKKAGPEPMWGPATHAWFQKIRHPDFTDWLSDLTGIAPLTADTLGGGMHCTGPGGRLESHVDFSVHPHLPDLIRRINMLVFLNDEWEQEWGGTLYLGKDRDVTVLPTFNRTVIFETSSRSWHGHPEPIVGDCYRRSLACYFYAPRRPDDDLIGSTVWVPHE